MEKLEILNSKKKKLLINKLNEQFGFNSKILKDYAVFLKKNDLSIKICTKDIDRIDTSFLKIDTIGLKIGKEFSDGIVLTIEGSQLLGKFCDKNILNLTHDELKLWLTGEDIETLSDESKFIILKYNDDFIGSAKLKEGKIINNVSKPRRLTITAL
ncbi:MAG: methyltransferase RsmF C-terminal domain-like protein [Candidatus Woesearchaeota archaeon]